MKVNVEREQIKSAMIEICEANVFDGFNFSFKDIEVLDHNHMNYNGFRVAVHANLHSIKDILKIDIGVGDIVTPNEESVDLTRFKGLPLFEGVVTLQVYPLETIFAEKFETIVAKGAVNSRMKDYHDIFLICRKPELLNSDQLRRDIYNTFENRQNRELGPIFFDDGDYEQLERLWAAHRRSLADKAEEFSLPSSIRTVVTEINVWLRNNNII
jgi:hypothetical protein